MDDSNEIFKKDCLQKEKNYKWNSTYEKFYESYRKILYKFKGKNNYLSIVILIWIKIVMLIVIAFKTSGGGRSSKMATEQMYLF